MKNKYILIILFGIVIIMILNQEIIINASKEGILLWFHQILPTLLPYSIMSQLLINSNLFELNLKNNYFHCIIILLIGVFFGFPIGSKITADFLERGMISHKKAQVLCVISNNMSPAFLSNYVLLYSLNQPKKLLLSCLILYGIPLLQGGCYLLFFTREKRNHKNTVSRFQLNMQIIDTGIIKSFETLIKLCGYIILSSILLHIFAELFAKQNIISYYILGSIEITNGIQLIAKSTLSEIDKYRTILTLLSFGGVCGFVQTASMIHSAKLSVWKYLLTKLLFACETFTLLYIIF